LALSQRPAPEALARRWFSYIICGVAAMIFGIVMLMSRPDRTLNNPKGDHEGRIGKLAPGPKAPQAGPATPPPHTTPIVPK
jgi:hypothetical protein